MSSNDLMHPRNVYRTPPNFKQMAIDYPEFRKYVKQEITGKIKIDFKDSDTLRVLSQTLLQKDFGLDVIFPQNRLVPTIPLRLNYILWLEDLLSICVNDTCVDNKCPEVHGIDIGTGSTCVYALLGAKKNMWKMTGTEIDIESLNMAQENINRNNLQHLIQVIRPHCDFLLKDVIDPNIKYNFCMCNPPFFSTSHELNPKYQSRSERRPAPRNAFTGQTTEVVASGGEVQFISKLIKESIDLKSQIKIFTTMVGHKSSTVLLKILLRAVEVTSFKQTEFHQGHTTRWGLAWTFQNIDLRKVPALSGNKKKIKPPPKIALPNNEGEDKLEDVVEKVRMILQSLQMTYEEIKKSQYMYALQATAKDNTWSYQRRKKREQMRQQNAQILKDEFNNPDEKMDLDISTTSAGSAESTNSNPKNNKRTRDEESDEEEYYNKKTKTVEEKVYLQFTLIIRKLDKDFFLEMIWNQGLAGKDTVQQVMQYFKNNYK